VIKHSSHIYLQVNYHLLQRNMVCECVCVCARVRAHARLCVYVLADWNKAVVQRISNRKFNLWMIHQGGDARRVFFMLCRTCVC